MQDSTSDTSPAPAGDGKPGAPCAGERCCVVELACNDHLTSAARLMQELHHEMTERYADDPRFVERFLNRRDCERELARLPGVYAPPAGAILLAICGEGELVGCVALRHADGEACELQRLYVRPARRGRGFGKALAEQAVRAARARGYRLVRATPMDAQWEARLLLRSLDFEDDDSTTGHALNPARRWQLMELDFRRAVDQADQRQEPSTAPASRKAGHSENTDPPPRGVASRP